MWQVRRFHSFPGEKNIFLFRKHWKWKDISRSKVEKWAPRRKWTPFWLLYCCCCCSCFSFDHCSSFLTLEACRQDLGLGMAVASRPVSTRVLASEQVVSTHPKASSSWFFPHFRDIPFTLTANTDFNRGPRFLPIEDGHLEDLLPVTKLSSEYSNSFVSLPVGRGEGKNKRKRDTTGISVVEDCGSFFKDLCVKNKE